MPSRCLPLEAHCRGTCSVFRFVVGLFQPGEPCDSASYTVAMVQLCQASVVLSLQFCRMAVPW